MGDIWKEMDLNIKGYKGIKIRHKKDLHSTRRKLLHLPKSILV